MQPYLDYETLSPLEVPTLDPHKGVIISGKLPHWLTVGLALTYRDHPWIAVMRAQKYDQAIVVASRLADYAPGQEVPVVTGSVQE